jgi:glycogen debranching enzyme
VVEPVAGLERLLSPECWPYASEGPVEADDPGRFHALFGRDAAVISLQILPARPDVARATLRTLARLQGSREDPETDEEPGKIVHEWWRRPPERLIRSGWPVRGGELRYYGSADSTSWFLVLMASLADDALSAELEPAWTAAGRWIAHALESGAGLIRHGPCNRPGGLAQQGWRDAEDPADPGNHGAGTLEADGEVPEPPLADVETQAVTVVALRAMSVLSGDGRWSRDAAELGTLIEESFDPETVALTGAGEKVAGPGSGLGWLLWADALSPVAAEAAADRLCRPDLLTPWGLRTLSSSHPLFAADAYHRGAVWPFDSWLGWGGLRAAGRTEVAERLRLGILAAIEEIGQAPELYAVGAEGPTPVPIANRVQAWTVGARWALRHRWDGRAKPLFG